MYTTFFFLPLPMMAFSCHAVSCQASCSSDMTINKYGFMLLSLPVAGFYDFFFLICEDKQLWSWDGAEALYSIVMFMTLSSWVYGIGHTTAIWEKSSLGVGSSLPHCFAFILFFFPEVKTRLLLVLLQYTGLSHSPPALIQQYRILTEISMHLAQMNNK